ncbi:glycosyltransferase family 2 protein [Mycobacterium avium subsp. hominissuis]|uniref:glycosyltransferase family 2 protein n=1 Tax=Mycobacterium avium TaxID=1764 RepID=UPI002666582D|nr:glycosyltransferase family 2 protein [Mycobacterium avium]MDO2386142.1 glycosyltransferase family 2 protein [Mycobacterium avium subsp. hominissuis]
MASVPTVSVITISFNDLRGLRRTVDSVRSQRYAGRIEHIVIDGGSGDEVVEYLSSCTPSFAYWQSEPDDGRYDAMNKGIARATGDLLWFMNSGDRFSDPDAVADVVEAISQLGPPRDIWGYGLVYLDGLGRLQGPMPFNLRKFLAGFYTVPHQAAFFGASLVDKLGGYNLTVGLLADQEFILRAALLREPITIRRLVCSFDTSGAGSALTSREAFGYFRRFWELHNRYPFGRRASLAYLRFCELVIPRTQNILAGLLTPPSRQSKSPRDLVVQPRKSRNSA